jgi:hypothetical protein
MKHTNKKLMEYFEKELPGRSHLPEAIYKEYGYQGKDKEPELEDYQSFVAALKYALETPKREKKEIRSACAKKLSVAIKNLDEVSREQVCDRMAGFLISELRSAGLKAPAGLLFNKTFKELPGKILDKVSDISFELYDPFCVVPDKLKPTGEEDKQRGPSVASDRPRRFVEAFGMCCFIEAKPSRGTLFYNLCILAIKELDYPAKDSRDLIEKVLNPYEKQ